MSGSYASSHAPVSQPTHARRSENPRTNFFKKRVLRSLTGSLAGRRAKALSDPTRVVVSGTILHAMPERGIPLAALIKGSGSNSIGGAIRTSA